MRIALQLLIIALLSIGGALAINQWHEKRPALYFVTGQLEDGEVEVAQALEWQQQENIVWIDARPKTKYDEGHVKGAFLLNEQDDFSALLEPIFHEIANNSDKQFVVYCASDSCAASKRVAELLRETVGVPDVWVLNGGVEPLRKAGLFP